MKEIKIDYQLLKGVLIAIVLALAWWAFVAGILVHMFHIKGVDAISRYLQRY